MAPHRPPDAEVAGWLNTLGIVSRWPGMCWSSSPAIRRPCWAWRSRPPTGLCDRAIVAALDVLEAQGSWTNARGSRRERGCTSVGSSRLPTRRGVCRLQRLAADRAGRVRVANSCGGGPHPPGARAAPDPTRPAPTPSSAAGCAGARPTSARGKDTPMAEGDLIQTGIAGLDALLHGGFPKATCSWSKARPVRARPCSGWSSSTAASLSPRARDDRGFEVAPQKLLRDAASFGWDLAPLQQQNQLKLLFTSPQVLSQELASPDSLLLETAAQMGAQRLFIDGLSLLRTVSPRSTGATATGTEGHYRQLLQQLLQGLQREQLTALLSHEVTAIDAAVLRLGDCRVPGRHRPRPAPRAPPAGQPPQPGDHPEPGPGL